MGLRIHTVGSFLVAGAAIAAGSLAALPPPEFARTPTASGAEAAERYAGLIEHFQPTGGRDHGGPNAWAMLVDAASAMRSVDARVWRGPAAGGGGPGVPDTYPDFALIFDPPAELTDQNQRNLALSLKLIGDYRAAGVFDKLGAMPATARAVRARVDTPEYKAALVALGNNADEEWDGKLVSVLLPELGSTRALARLNVAVMHQAAQVKDTRGFLAAFEQTLATARVCAHQPGLIDRLVADAVGALVATRATKAIRAGWTDPAMLDGVVAALDRQTKWPSLRLAMEGERLLALDACRWAFDAQGRPDPRAFTTLGSMASQPLDFTKFSGPLPTRDETVKALNEYHDKLAAVQAPSARGRAEIVGELNAYLEGLPPGQLLVRLLTGALKPMFEADARTSANFAVLRATVALEKHKARTGEYPAALADLKPAIDVNDPWTDLPLRYARTAAGHELTSAAEDVKR